MDFSFGRSEVKLYLAAYVGVPMVMVIFLETILAHSLVVEIREHPEFYYLKSMDKSH